MIRHAGSYSLATSDRSRGSRAHRILGIASARLIAVLAVFGGEVRRGATVGARLEFGFAPNC